MKKVLTILFSLIVVFAMAQQRTGSGPKPINHGPGTCPGFIFTPVDGAVTFPSDLVENILGPDITSYSSVTFAGLQGNPDASSGLFTGGVNAGIGVEEGICLSSGYISNALGPNTADNISADLGLGGDAQLTALAGQATLDATVLEFDFVPNFTQLFIEYSFGSDEYNEYAVPTNLFNDVFAFYLNGTNIALVPSTTLPVSIQTINLTTNSIYFKNNGNWPSGPFPYCTEMDGFTTVLVASGAVNNGQTNHIKLAIADARDHIYDSWVFIKASSFGGTNPEVPISNWALYIGIFLILTFTVIRFRKLV
jgi:hypothetical protein